MNAEALKRAATITPCQAVFYTWEELSDLYTAILSGYFERSIPVGVTGDERGDGWFLRLWDAPLSSEEINTLLDTLKADDYDRDANDFGSYPIMELSQSIGQRIVAIQSPFSIDASYATDEGVWFTGKAPAGTVRLLIQYPEADCHPDILSIPLEEDITKEAVITAFHKALRFEDPEVQEEWPDRLTRLDLVIADMGLALNTKITACSIDAEFEIR